MALTAHCCGGVGCYNPGNMYTLKFVKLPPHAAANLVNSMTNQSRVAQLTLSHGAPHKIASSSPGAGFVQGGALRDQYHACMSGIIRGRHHIQRMVDGGLATTANANALSQVASSEPYPGAPQGDVRML
jgi:hypothetical protein